MNDAGSIIEIVKAVLVAAGIYGAIRGDLARLGAVTDSHRQRLERIEQRLDKH